MTLLRRICLSLLLTGAFSLTASAQSSDSLAIRRIYDEVLTNSRCYGWLDFLSNRIGGRLSGSPQAAQAVDYVKLEMNKLLLDSVWLQEVMVPHWQRGEAEAGWMVVKGKKTPLSVCALGGSIATSTAGISGEVVEVHDWDELEKLGEPGVKGKIVFMNHPMKPQFVSTFDAYGEAAKYRGGTASRAAKLGAKAVIVRSMTLALDDHPHTGGMSYVDSIAKIPACAISTVGAELLSKTIKQEPRTVAGFRQSCQTFDDTLSHNVIAEIRGSEFPDEIIVVGGHLDSWDNGDGSHDDGAGIVQSMEVLRIFKSLGLKPKRSIRFVAFMNEENGARGGKKYAEAAKSSSKRHVAAIESDAGGFTPRGFTFRGDSSKMNRVIAWQQLFYPYLLRDWRPGWGGVDINFMEDQGTLLIGFSPDSQRYFDVHHAETDTFDKINKRELELGAGAMAALTWMISEYGVGGL